MKTDKGTLDRMTPQERLKEVASLLARGFLRAHAGHTRDILPQGGAQELDLPVRKSVHASGNDTERA